MQIIIAAPIGTPFVEILRRALKARGMTQEQLAEKLGVKQPRVSEVFRSESITEAVFDRFADALGVEIEVKIVK